MKTDFLQSVFEVLRKVDSADFFCSDFHSNYHKISEDFLVVTSLFSDKTRCLAFQLFSLILVSCYYFFFIVLQLSKDLKFKVKSFSPGMCKISNLSFIRYDRRKDLRK